MLKDKEITQTVRLVRLNEGMADERSTLLDMQQILNLPYQLSNCRCFKVSNHTKQLIN